MVIFLNEHVSVEKKRTSFSRIQLDIKVQSFLGEMMTMVIWSAEYILQELEWNQTSSVVLLQCIAVVLGQNGNWIQSTMETTSEV